MRGGFVEQSDADRTRRILWNANGDVARAFDLRQAGSVGRDRTVGLMVEQHVGLLAWSRGRTLASASGHSVSLRQNSRPGIEAWRDQDLQYRTHSLCERN
ncbi:hypothetical protein D3C87_1963320 [compost metagenome]